MAGTSIPVNVVDILDEFVVFVSEVADVTFSHRSRHQLDESWHDRIWMRAGTVNLDVSGNAQVG